MKVLIFSGILILTIVVMVLLPEPCKLNRGGFFISIEFRIGLLYALLENFFIAFPVLMIFVYQVTQSLINRNLSSFSLFVIIATSVIALCYYKHAHNKVVEEVSKENVGGAALNCAFSRTDLLSTDISTSKAGHVFLKELKIIDSTGDRPTESKVLRAWIEQGRGRRFSWLFFSKDYVIPTAHFLCVEVQGQTVRNYLVYVMLDDAEISFESANRINSSGNRIFYFDMRMCYLETWKTRVDVDAVTALEVLSQDQGSLTVRFVN